VTTDAPAAPLTPATARYLRTRITGTYDPAALAVRLARSGLFDQYVVYERAGRWWFAGGVLGAATVRSSAVETTWAGRRQVTARAADHPVRELGRALRAMPLADWHAYGWVTFESALAVPDPGRPLAHLLIPRLEAEIDTGTLDVRATDADLLERVLTLAATTGPPALADPRRLDVEAAGPGPYLDAVTAAVERIRAGELEKVILSRRVEVPFALDFPGTYLTGRRANTPARSFLLDLAGLRATGFSPETVAEVSPDGRVTSQPLAGTRARRRDPHADDRNRAELLTDPKEVYEHAISVKFADTELRGLCAPGSVTVGEFMALKERGSVHHLGSRVAGRLRADRTMWDALAVLFPAVTASGIPKAAAYEVIQAYEPGPRGLYSGAVLRATGDGDLDAALVLRTVFTHEGRTWLQAGAGVVADSRPAREYRETCEKLASVAPYLVPAG
jgi:salicylate synthetase